MKASSSLSVFVDASVRSNHNSFEILYLASLVMSYKTALMRSNPIRLTAAYQNHLLYCISTGISATSQGYSIARSYIASRTNKVSVFGNPISPGQRTYRFIITTILLIKVSSFLRDRPMHVRRLRVCSYTDRVSALGAIYPYYSITHPITPGNAVSHRPTPQSWGLYS